MSNSRRGLFTIGAGLIVAALAAGCSASPETTAPESGGLPAKLELQAIQDLSGTSGPGGVTTQEGMQIAVAEINELDFLGGTELSITWSDSATDPTKAANAMTQAVATGSPIIFGSFTSGTALAEAPIAQRAGVPTIFTQAGAKGVLDAGDVIYRATPLQTSYFANLTLGHLKDQGAKRVAAIYDTDVPTIVDLFEVFRESADEYGYEIVAAEATTSQTIDVSSQITKILETDPDAIFVNVLLAHNVQVIQQLRQSGYDGLIVAQQGAGGGVLAPLGDLADGVVLATDYNALSDIPESKNFAERYEAEFGRAPGNFAAEGYDAVWFAARALLEAQSIDRGEVLAALAKVAQAGFKGALGDVTFDGRQEVTPGVLVMIQDGIEVPVK